MPYYIDVSCGATAIRLCRTNETTREGSRMHGSFAAGLILCTKYKVHAYLSLPLYHALCYVFEKSRVENKSKDSVVGFMIKMRIERFQSKI